MIYSLDTEPLPDGYVPLEAYAVIKCLDEDGDTVIVTRSTDTLALWDSIGLLTCALDTQRESARRGFIPDRQEDADDDD